MLTKETQQRRPWSGSFCFALGVALVLALSPTTASSAEPVKLASWLVQLSVDDVARYRKIFSLQEDGNWRRADQVIKTLDNRLLIGRVLFQRYMHPTKYRSRYKELFDWMKNYADQPGAKRIYRLALHRQPKGYKSPRHPSDSADRSSKSTAEPAYKSTRKRSSHQRRLVGNVRHGIVRQLRRGNPRGAETRLNRKETRRLLDNVEFDEMRRRVAAAYFFKGDDPRAFKLATLAAKRSPRDVPLADWTAGMSAWRMGQSDVARKHFEALARSQVSSGWNVAAGAFWAARANLVTERPGQVSALLVRAASYPHTFYGLIAARLLGRDIAFNWAPPPLDEANARLLLGSAAVRRAIGLRQVDQIHWAESEFAIAVAKADPAKQASLLGLANRLELARAQLTIGHGTLGAEVGSYDSAKYPLPAYRQKQWFGIDHALVYAFILQESQFNSRAESPRGARGLMQLMPRPASAMARDRNLRRRDRWRLFSPELNIELGQKYLSHLIGLKEVQGNLFLMAAAYNGGPGNLRKWRRRTNHGDDPLLFIESLPSLETRLFIERVLANFWIYRERLGQDTPSLDAIAAGNWPYYFTLDVKGVRVAQNRAKPDRDFQSQRSYVD